MPQADTTAIPVKESFSELLDQSFREMTSIEGSVVSGTVLSVEKDMILIDIGLKSEGRVPLREFGNNEEEIKILPAINKALSFNWNIKGPLPTDSLFYQAGLKKFDLIVAMYHDQGHGPVKFMGIDEGINITVGLPLIRTSVDHGTAYDIAGVGTAKEDNMKNAIYKAFNLIKK